MNSIYTMLFYNQILMYQFRIELDKKHHGLQNCMLNDLKTEMLQSSCDISPKFGKTIRKALKLYKKMIKIKDTHKDEFDSSRKYKKMSNRLNNFYLKFLQEDFCKHYMHVINKGKIDLVEYFKE